MMKIPDITLDMRWTRILGFYLLCLVTFQIYIYGQLKNGIDILFYFDPRIGLAFLLNGLLGIDKSVVMLIEWLSAFLIGSIALVLFIGRPIVKIYIVSEVLLSLPNLIFTILVLCINMHPAHGFSIRELFCPLLVMLYTTIVPFLLIIMRATLIWRK